MKLNLFQEGAVKHKDGPILILAGPGSGKTSVIIHRTIHLIENHNIKSSQILILTFSKSAANEMKERYKTIKMDGVTFQTIHSLCYKIICDKEGVEALNINSDNELDMLIEKAYAYMLEDDSLCMRWQKRYSYIMVDEFQDTSMLQAGLIFLMAEKKRNIMVVGDDDQSIYHFRNATPEVFRVFKEVFEEAKMIQLKINYRCDRKIIDLAEKLIKNNVNRIEKDEMIFMNESTKKTVYINEYQNQWIQMVEIVKQIKELRVPYNKIVVLFRTRQQFRMFGICCAFYGVPICCENLDIKKGNYLAEDILSYLRIICNIGKRDDYLRVMNKPDRGLTREFLDNEWVDEEKWLNKAKMYREDEACNVKKFLDELENLRKLPPYLGMCTIYNIIGYKRMMLEQVKDNDISLELTEGVLDKFLNMSKKHKLYLNLIKEAEGVNLKYSGDGLRVMTMHASKGLEFDYVFLPDLNADIIPNKKAVLSSGIEEERRLLYVAITRAKEGVYLSWVSNKNRVQTIPSQFIDEIL